MQTDKKTSTIKDKIKIQSMPKKESESHNKHRTEQKLCTRAKDNLSKKKKWVYIVEEKRSFLAF
jgi:hypothetical protein